MTRNEDAISYELEGNGQFTNSEKRFTNIVSKKPTITKNQIIEQKRFQKKNNNNPEQVSAQIKGKNNNNLFQNKKKIFIFQIYYHLNKPIDYFLIILALLGSIGTGISKIAQIYISSDIFSEIGNTSESKTQEEVFNMMQIVEKSLNNQINKLLIFGTISFVCNFLSVTFWNFLGQRNMHHLKYKYFSLILKQEQAWFDKNNPFEFATKIQTQLEHIELGIGEIFGNMIGSLVQCILGFIISFITSWKLTLIILCILPFLLIILCIMLNYIQKRIMISRKIYEKAGGIAEEILYNIKTVSSFANFDFEIERYNHQIDENYKAELGKIYILSIFMGLLMFILYVAIFISLLYGRTLIQKEYNSNKKRKFTGGDVVIVTFCTLMGVIGIGMLFPNIKIILEACSAFSDYYNLSERKIPMDFSQSKIKPDKSQVKGEIIFKNVTFKYETDSKEKIILSDINLEFKCGKKIALVGESGCGKSTIVNLIERLYEANSGEILIDNVEIKKYDIEYLRSLIGYVQQEPVLFNKSIKDNIIFGREEYFENEEILEKSLQQACDESFATEFINNLEEKWNYVVGIKGSKLSGGQKQRIAIARAILTKPKILILDEATSSLDYKSEKEVQIALDNICKKNVTTIIIAHRLSTIKNADLIYSIKEGKIIEKGNHQELLEKNGYYASLVKSQLIKEELMERKEQDMLEKGSNLNMKKKEKNNNCYKDKDKFIAKDEITFQISKIFNELKDKKINLIFACLGAVLVGGINPFIGVMAGQAINGMNSIYQNVRYNDGLKYGLFLLFFAFLQGLGNILMNWQFMVLGAYLIKKYRKKIFEKYLQIDMSYFDLEINSPGSLITRLSMDTTQLNSLLLSILGSSLSSISIFIVGFILGCIFEYRLTLILLIFIAFLVLSMILRRILNNNNSIKGMKAKIEAGGIFSECVSNTKTIYSYNFQKKAVELYMEFIDFLKKKYMLDSFISGLFIGLGQFCIFAAHSTVLYAAKIFILKRQINSENLDLILSVVLTMAGGIAQGMANIGDFKKAKNAFKSLYSILDYKSKISAFKRDNEKKISPENIIGKIEFKNVYFSYPTNPQQIVLQNISFIIEPGQHVAFVGYSGSGKSTIFQLLQRFYDIEDGKGEILIDGINIKNYNLNELRKKIGYVNQEPVLFKRNILENIRYGKLEASNEECIQAAKDANIMDILEKEAKNEIDNDKKNINDNCKNENPISGGEKQRLAIARVFLKNPIILLFDEATSSLDKNNEIEVQNSLNKLAINKTTISIAHRLNTIEKCDMIYVFENGKIKEKGKHQELMELKKLYYNLYKYSEY